MAAPLVVLFLIVPFVELWIIVQAAQTIGLGETIVLLIAVSVAGAWLVKREGVATWRRLRAALQRGEMPAGDVVDGALILFAGALLLTPGFLSDAFGLLLLFPPTRSALKRSGRGLLRWWTWRRFGVSGEVGRRVYESRVVEGRKRQTATRSEASTTPSLPDAPSADDSRGRG